MKEISEKTWVPLGFAVVMIGGGAWWLASMQAQANSLSKDVGRVEAKQETYNEHLSEIHDRLTAIETALKIKGERK